MQTEQIFRVSKLRTLGYWLLAAGFVAGGFWMLSEGEVFGWYLVVFFGIGVLTFTINLLPNSSYLVLSSEGFKLRSLYRETAYKWTDVETFRVGRIATKRMIVFNFSSDYPRQRRLRRIVGALIGTEGALPDSYGMSLQQLADRLNAAKEEALRNVG